MVHRACKLALACVPAVDPVAFTTDVRADRTSRGALNLASSGMVVPATNCLVRLVNGSSMPEPNIQPVLTAQCGLSAQADLRVHTAGRARCSPHQPACCTASNLDAMYETE